MSAVVRMIRSHLLFAIGLAVLGTGLFASVGALRRVADARQALKTQSQWTQDLKALAMQAQGIEARQATISAMTQAPVVPLQDILQETLEEFLPSEMRNLTVPAVEGWTLHRQELTFQSVPLPALMRFVKAAERLDSPWRLESIDIFSSSVKPGYARVVLTMGAASQNRR